MKKRFVNTYLERIYEDKKSFIDVFGTEKLFDPKFMLIADIASEHQELFSDAILEAIQSMQEQNIVSNTYSLASLSRKN